MRQTGSMLVALLLLTTAATAAAQTIDAGRGELPVHVPGSYDGESRRP